MSSIRLSGTSSGYYDLTVPAVAGTNSIDLSKLPVKDASDNLALTSLDVTATMRMPNASSDPGSANLGEMYYNTTDNVMKIYTGSQWETLANSTLRNGTFDIFGDNSTVALYLLDGNGNDQGGTYNLSGDTSSGNFTGGKYGQAFNGTGTNHLIEDLGSFQTALPGDYSLSFWYNSSNTAQNNKRVFTIKGGAQAAGWSNFNNSLGFYKGTGGQNLASSSSVTRVAEIPDASINDGNWHHLVFTITSGGSHNIYLDGNSYSGAVSGEGRSFNVSSYLAITTYDNNDGYNTICKIDQARVLNRAINSVEVAQLYNAI